MKEKTDFLFYTELDRSGDIQDLPALTRRLVSFATGLGLEGNIWQQWLAYMILTDENEFSLACERKQIDADSTLMKLAAPDMSKFMELMHMEPVPLMGSYTQPYNEKKTTQAGERIAHFAEKLADTENEDAFGRIVSEEYAKYGTGIYGLYRAFRVEKSMGEARMVPVTETSDVCFDDLIGYEEQKTQLRENTEAFLRGEHANNVLLYGDSGTGKSTSVHALMHDYYDEGLRLIEIGKQERKLLSKVLSMAKKRNYRFIIFLDDLSFEEDESDYKELKAMLEGALESREDRVIIYATSNRRHLIKETWNDRADMEHDGDIHRSDTMEEKLSLASRFGITIYYAKPDYKGYLGIVSALADRNGVELDETELESEARKWELRHGGTSGRTASQLITWLSGKANKQN
ncbi:MAG: ATP-binding protein [Mogibacterium sp.]|nr:ATP-binding protein [Mogibacterium sp.]